MAGDSSSAVSRKSSIAASGLISGGAAGGLALFIAVTANSVALWADWAATILDLLAVFVAWWGLRKSEVSRDDQFNYGFGRFESLTSMGMAALMIISFVSITAAAVVRFGHPVPVKGPGVLIGIGLHVIFGFINVRLTVRSMRLERREPSPLITAQRRVFTVKAAGNMLMFSSLTIAYFAQDHLWASYADPVAATIIGLTLLASASKMFKFSVRDLLDCALEEESKLLIIRVLAHNFDRYEQIHEIRTRRAGSRVYVEIFLEFSQESRHGVIMETIRSLQKEIREAINCDEVLVVPV